jgi:Fe2+ transport system protein B
MTIPGQENQEINNGKEFNFRQIEKQLQQERAARMEAERLLAERHQIPEEEDESEPYVDHKKLNKKLAKFSEVTRAQTKADMEQMVKTAVMQDRNERYLKQNPDFYKVIEQHAQKIEDTDPDLAESILHMPQGFQRDVLVYKNIKALGLDKPAVKAQTTQEKVDSNRKSPYYQPHGVGTAPYSSSADFSESGQKQAYEKMKQLQKMLRT